MADLDPYAAYSRESLVAMLRWQLEAGVTEALSPEPYDRFSAAAAAPAATTAGQELPPAYAPTGDSPLAQAHRRQQPLMPSRLIWRTSIRSKIWTDYGPLLMRSKAPA